MDRAELRKNQTPATGISRRTALRGIASTLLVPIAASLSVACEAPAPQPLPTSRAATPETTPTSRAIAIPAKTTPTPIAPITSEEQYRLLINQLSPKDRELYEIQKYHAGSLFLQALQPTLRDRLAGHIFEDLVPKRLDYPTSVYNWPNFDYKEGAGWAVRVHPNEDPYFKPNSMRSRFFINYSNIYGDIFVNYFSNPQDALHPLINSIIIDGSIGDSFKNAPDLNPLLRVHDIKGLKYRALPRENLEEAVARIFDFPESVTRKDLVDFTEGDQGFKALVISGSNSDGTVTDLRVNQFGHFDYQRKRGS